MIKQIRAAVAGAAILLASFHASAGSITYDFYKLTDNNVEDLSGQLSITLWSYDMANDAFGSTTGWVTLDATQVLFTVQNDVGIASNISEIYFDDGLLGPATAINSLDGFTSFTGGGATPGNLPGGLDAVPEFNATVEFSADVDSGNPTNGIDASNDILGILLGTGSLLDYDGVVAAVESGDLRFGLHVRSIGIAGGSDSYISPPGTIDPDPAEVPVPGTLFLLGLGLLGLARTRRRR